MHVCSSPVIISTSLTSTSSHLGCESSTGRRQFLDFLFFWPPSVLKSSRKPLITEGGKLIVFALYLSFPPCGRASLLKFLLVFPETVLSCLLTSTPGTAHRMTDPSRASPWRAGDPGAAGGLKKGTGCPNQPSLTLFKGSPIVWQINIILMDVSACSTNKAGPCVTNSSPLSFPLHVIFKLFFFFTPLAPASPRPPSLA